MYKGKYERAYTCIHALQIGMELVYPDKECSEKVKLNSGYYVVSKRVCNICPKYEKRTDGKETPRGYGVNVNGGDSE